jgi:hypothetical protein
MKTTTILSLTAAAAVALAAAACDRNTATTEGKAQQQAGAGSSAPSQSSTPTTPANVGPPQSQAERRESTNPVQQQVDPKEGEQHRDFRTKGEGAGPRPGGG